MTYGTFTTIKQALEALNIRESVIISLVDGEVHIFDKEDYIDTIKEEWEEVLRDELESELRDEIYDEAYDEGYRDGVDEATAENDIRR